MTISKPHMTRDLSIVVVSRVIQMALLFLTLRAMTSRLSPAEVGNFSLLVSISTLFVWPLISPVGLYVNRHTLQWLEHGTVWRNYAIEGAYILVIAAFAGAALFAWETIFHPAWTDQFVWLAPALTSYIIFSVANTTVIPAVNLLGRRIAYAVLYAVTQLLQLIICWVLAGNQPLGEYWFWGQTAGFALGFFMAVPYFAKATTATRAQTMASIDYRVALRDIAAFTLPIAVTLVLNWIQFQSYRVLVGKLVSLQFLGVFFAGYTASAGIMAAIEVTASQFFGPYFYKHVQESKPEDQHDAWAAYMSALYPMMLVIIMVMVALAQPIAHVLLAKRFSAAGPYIAVGAIAEGVRVLANTYALAAHASKRTQVLLFPYSVGAISILLLLAGGTLMLGESAVGPAMVLSALIFLAAIHFTMTRHARTSLSLLGWRWVGGAAALLAVLRLSVLAMPVSGLGIDLGMLVLGGVVAVGAFFLIARDALSVLARFAG